MVIDNTATGDKLEDSVFWYKAPMRTNVKIGSKALWRYHEQNYDRAKAMRGPDLYAGLNSDGSVGSAAQARGRAAAHAIINGRAGPGIRVVKRGSKKRPRGEGGGGGGVHNSHRSASVPLLATEAHNAKRHF
jgi:hypothetical protein